MREILEAKGQTIKEFAQLMLPDHMINPVMDWLWHGHMPGSFLTSVLENNLKEAALRADTKNSEALANWAKFCVWYLPAACWGCDENVKEWSQSGGWNGMLRTKGDL